MLRRLEVDGDFWRRRGKTVPVILKIRHMFCLSLMRVARVGKREDEIRSVGTSGGVLRKMRAEKKACQFYRMIENRRADVAGWGDEET